eukprot:m.239440 g.239440  ORF g.239440 m.239440 type:complete len:997 (+) comp33745_c3_seq4:289-3279(+)
MFGGMQVKAPEPEETPPPDTAGDGADKPSAFSFMKQSAVTSPPEDPPDEEQPKSAFSFMKKPESAAPVATPGSGFSFIRKDSSESMTSESSASFTTLTPTMATPQLSVPVANAVKKKKVPRKKPGYAVAEQQGTMVVPHEGPGSPGYTASLGPSSTTSAPKPQSSEKTAPVPSKTTPKTTTLPPQSQSPQPARSETRNREADAPKQSPLSTTQTSTASRPKAPGSSQQPQATRQTPTETKTPPQQSEGAVGTFRKMFGFRAKAKTPATTQLTKQPATNVGRQTRGSPTMSRPRSSSQRDKAATIAASSTPRESTSTTTPSTKVVQGSIPQQRTPSPSPSPSPKQATQPDSSPKEGSHTRSLKKAPNLEQQQPPQHDDEDDDDITTNNNDDDDDDGPPTASQKSVLTVTTAKADVAKLHERFDVLDAEQSQLLQSANAALQDSVDMRRDLKEKSAQLEEAIASEDFELADDIENEIASLKLKLDTEVATVDRSSLQQGLTILIESKQATWDDEIALHQKTMDELQNVIHGQEEEARVFEFELDAATSEDRAELDSSQAKLKKARAHMHLDKTELEEEMLRYRKKADEKTAVFVKEKNRLTTARDSVAERIAELRSELKRLEQDEEDLTKAIVVQDDRIEQAEAGLSTEKNKMDEESAAISQRESELSAEQEALDIKAARLKENEAEFRSQHEDLHLSLNDARDHIAFAIKRKKTLADLKASLSKFLETNTCVFDPSTLLDNPDNNEVATLRKTVAEASAFIQELTSSVLEQQARSSAIRKELDDIENRIPELERAKKLAVSGRNFKDAGNINNEIKMFGVTQGEKKIELEELNGKLLAQTEELDEAKEQQSRMQEELKSSEAEFDLSLFEQLKSKSVFFRESILQHASSNTEIGKLLRSDAETCELLLAQLSIKHDIDWKPEEETLDELIARAEKNDVLISLDGASSDANNLMDMDDDFPVAQDLLGGLTIEPTNANDDADGYNDDDDDNEGTENEC